MIKHYCIKPRFLNLTVILSRVHDPKLTKSFMLRQRSWKRHRIILPPPPQKKKSPFFLGGGVAFFGIKSSIFESGRNKKFWRDFGVEWTLPVTFRPIIGHYRPETHNWNFKNIAFWTFFRQFVDFFFFLNDNLVQDHPEMIKNSFFEFLWTLNIIYIHFWMNFEKVKFWFFEHFSNLKPSFSRVLSQHVNSKSSYKFSKIELMKS